MDLDWCLTCSQHTSGELYCSDECRREDISYAIKVTSSSSYSFYSKPIHPPSPTFSYRSTTKSANGDTTPSDSPAPSPTSQISAAILDEPQSQDSSYQSSNEENVITSQYTKIHPWMNQRRQQRRYSVLT
uniref:Extender of the chronological lifespan protein 2 n=1 Tax=Anthurium amnicola TaxID=1678845 RepID=A0A1D1YCZ1_9ARAE